jgi:hypothetical protein
MSFAPQAARRHQATAGLRIARLTRRALLTGGCAAAGWIGVSLLAGGAAHAATAHPATAHPADQSPISAIVNQLPTDKQQGLSGITDLAQRTITAHPARSVHLSSIQKSIGDVDHRLPKSISDQLDKATKPLTDQVVTPVTRAAKQATAPLATDNPISQTVSSVQKPVRQLTNVLHRTTADLHLPGITVPTVTSPQTPHLPVAVSPVALHPASLVQQPTRHATRHHAAARHAHHRATAPAVSTAGPARSAVQSMSQVGPTRFVLPVPSVVRHLQHLRIPAPNAPPAPGVPAPNTGTGGGSSGSGPVGGSAIGTLDSAADAGFRALGTVDPTDAGMARCVAQRPAASPD